MTEPGGPKTRELACTPATANEKKRRADEMVVSKKKEGENLVKTGCEVFVGCYS